MTSTRTQSQRVYRQGDVSAIIVAALVHLRRLDPMAFVELDEMCVKKLGHSFALPDGDTVPETNY